MIKSIQLHKLFGRFNYNILNIFAVKSTKYT